MKIMNRKVLDKFVKSHRNDEQLVNGFRIEVDSADWSTHGQMMKQGMEIRVIHLDSANKVSRVVFKLVNRVRVLAKVFFKYKQVSIERCGTHEEYNKWNY